MGEVLEEEVPINRKSSALYCPIKLGKSLTKTLGIFMSNHKQKIYYEKFNGIEKLIINGAISLEDLSEGRPPRTFWHIQANRPSTS